MTGGLLTGNGSLELKGQVIGVRSHCWKAGLVLDFTFTYVFCLYICICTTCVSGALEAQKNGLDALEWGCQVVVSHHCERWELNPVPLRERS